MFWILMATYFIVLSKGEPIRNPVLPLPLKQNSSTLRIVGGEPARIEDHPWQVSISRYGDLLFCGGSIISNRVIPTAGHCVDPYSFPICNVRVGSKNAHEDGIVMQIAEVIRHENFTNIHYHPINDIALLKLDGSIEFHDKAQPIELPDQGEAAPVGTPANVTGWDAYENGTSSKELRVVQVPLVDKKTCNEAYMNEFGGIAEGQFCAGYLEGGKDSCSGDSGGPLAIGRRQFGMVSWGIGCASKNYPGVYTDIAYHRDWIAKHAGV